MFEDFQCRFMLVGRLGTPEAAVAGGSLPPNDVCRMSQPFTLPLPVLEAVTIVGDSKNFFIPSYCSLQMSTIVYFVTLRPFLHEIKYHVIICSSPIYQASMMHESNRMTR